MAAPTDRSAPEQGTFMGFKIRPRPPAFAQGRIVPEYEVNFVSHVMYSWMTPFTITGLSRPIEIDDVWHLPDYLQANVLGTALERAFASRCPPSRRPRHLRHSHQTATAPDSNEGIDSKDDPAIELGDTNGLRALGGSQPISAKEDKGKKVGRRRKPKQAEEGDELPEETSLPKAEEGGKVYSQSLLFALNQVVWKVYWSSGALGLIGFTLQTVTPLVTEKLLAYIQVSYAYAKGHSDVVPPSIGHGIGLAFAIWAMQQLGSLVLAHYYGRALIAGFMARSSLISIISRKSLRLSGEARTKHSNGQLITHISADASFFDWAAILSHELWLQPIQLIIGLIILLVLLGPTALVGLAVLLLGIPLQAWLMSLLIGTRQAQMKITDQRVRLLQEVLQGIRVIKLMAYEGYFGNRISEFRRQELRLLLRNCLASALMSSTMALIPVVATVLTFITYALSGHDLSPSVIFAALAAFNNIKFPLMIIPMALQTCSDAYVALVRISKIMLAQEIDNPIPVRPDAPFAIAAHADYAWESAEPLGANSAEGTSGRDRDAGKKKRKEKRAAKEAAKEAGVDGEEGKEEEAAKVVSESAAPFQLKYINIDIPRGAFVVICGRVGSGKSSLVQALIGEMKMLKGEAYLGGSTSYFPQAPWVQNATLRENIVFGDPNVDEDRFDEAVRACALEPDIAMLTHGLQTEIGERGINLSGGQKARVCLARAVYANSDICVLDDPLSAVDAHVSKTLVECFTTGPLAKKTRVLVTHHLEVLPQADLIITMLDGKVAEIGSYAELMAAEGALSKLVQEHVADPHQAVGGGGSPKGPAAEIEIEPKEIEEDRNTFSAVVPKTETTEESTKEKGALIMDEERETGAVTWGVYGTYIKSMGGLWKAPLFLTALVLAQASEVGNTVLLGKWSESSTPGAGISGWTRSDYMGTYAGLGLSYTFFTFCGTFLLFFSGVRASFNLFNKSLSGVMRTPVGWHDQTPIGRILSRLSKDITVLDEKMPEEWTQLLTMGLNIFGTIALVFYSFPYLGLLFIPLLILYYIAACFYRATSREVKRVESTMRSFLYAAFGEMLTGLASIRAYRAEERFIKRNEDTLDVQNRCSYVTVILQCWLMTRLDLLGNLLVLAIALFGVGFRNTVSPSKVGVVLTYSLALSQLLSEIVNTFAQVEMSMNTAERVVHYTKLEPEAATHTKNDPPADWPARGEVKFDNVVMRYRDDLPPVLKGTSFTVKPGEKIGIVGRTGAGKSSLLQALFRIVELSLGTISIDGVDLSTIGLDPIRRQLGIVPQDPLIWSGKVRENLDPENTHTDVELLSALKRCNLLAADDATSEVKARLAKFELEAVVQDEGSNFSAGERQLMALARVVVRNSRIIVLDEATSSVDVETDQLIQETIRNEFTNQTLLTIAHRLSTISFYDRVIVMDAGLVAEIGPPLELFDQRGSAFRSMCDKASLTRDDIVRIRR